MSVDLTSGVMGWFARHLIALFVLAYLLVGYQLRAMLWPEAFAAAAVAETMTKAPDANQTLAVPEATPSARQDEIAIAPHETAPVVAAVPPESRLDDPDPNRVEMEIAGSTAKISDPVAETVGIGGEASAPVEQARPLMPTMNDSVIENTASSFRPEQVQSTNGGALSRSDQRRAARKAYWNQDLGTARELYLGLLAQTPDDPDLLGEVGNLYLAIGDKQAAMDAYYRAARIFRDMNNVDRTTELAALLTTAGDPRAQSLSDDDN